MNSYAISSLITAITSIPLGFYVYFKDKTVALNKVFCLLTLSIAVWSIGICFTVSSNNPRIAIFWGKIIYVGSILIIPFFMHYIFTLLDKDKEKKRTLFSIYIIAFIFLIMNLTNLLVKGVIPKPISYEYNYEVSPGKLMPLFYLYFFW